MEGESKSTRRRGARLGTLIVLVAWVELLVGPLGAAWAGERLSAPEAHARALAGKLLIIDVRSPAEWRQTGVAKGARPVTIHDPDGAAGFLKAMLAAVGGDKTRPIAIICARGARSARANRFLQAKGFTRVHDMSEGMLGRGSQPGWIARGLPVVPCDKC